jgi:hypothetical protein
MVTYAPWNEDVLGGSATHLHAFFTLALHGEE